MTLMYDATIVNDILPARGISYDVKRETWQRVCETTTDEHYEQQQYGKWFARRFQIQLISI